MVRASGKKPSPPAEHQLEAVTHLSQQNIHKLVPHANVPDPVTHAPPGKKQMFLDSGRKKGHNGEKSTLNYEHCSQPWKST